MSILIPSNKFKKFTYGNRQVCVYGFSQNALQLFKKNKQKTSLEKIEDIEILRFLENKKSVKMIKTTGSEISIDTPKDYELAKKLYLENLE
jgi:3-deoxy-manno-octulosonate cytidylyltransferase (CMP-KDO synthetase)